MSVTETAAEASRIRNISLSTETIGYLYQY